MKLVFPKANRSSAKVPRSSSGWCERALISSTTAWSTLWAPAPHIGAPPSTRWSTSSRASPRHAPASCHRHLCRRCLGLFQSCDDKSSKNDLLSKVEDMVRSVSPMINEPHLQAMPMVYYPAQYIPADEVLVRVPRQLAQGNSGSFLSQICSWWNTFVTISSPQGPLRPVRQSDFAADQEASADTAYGAAPVTCNILHLRHHDSIELNMLICLESDHWVDILLRLLDVSCHSIKLKLKQLQQLCHGKRN